MKKILVSGSIIVVFVFYSIFYHKTSSTVLAATERTNALSRRSNATQSKAIIYKNGVYKGTAADAFYGTLQVKITIQNGKLTDVQFLQHPHSNAESVAVNEAAMPSLKQEALQTQNAQVDLVSGATQTSLAFRESLAAALSQAK